MPGLQGILRRDAAAADRRRGQAGAGEGQLPQLHDHRAAVGAGRGRGWNYLELFYRNQGTENSGYADDEFLTAVAEAAGVTDIAAWNKARAGTKITGEVKKTTEEAERLGFTGTPSFAIRGPNTKGMELLGTPTSLGEFESAIEAAG